MPIMNGIELITQIRKSNNSKIKNCLITTVTANES